MCVFVRPRVCVWVVNSIRSFSRHSVVFAGTIVFVCSKFIFIPLNEMGATPSHEGNVIDDGCQLEEDSDDDNIKMQNGRFRVSSDFVVQFYRMRV